MQAIIAEIESLYLGQNTNANYVNKALNLMTVLTNRPNVSIAWNAVNAQTGDDYKLMFYCKRKQKAYRMIYIT